ncbi:MAG: hypothetical protein AAF458_04210 [Pseudomonadota bacterium]
MGNGQFLIQQADSFARRAAELSSATTGYDQALVGLYRKLAVTLYYEAWRHGQPSPMSRSARRSRPTSQSGVCEYMSNRNDERLDPFNNETELLKQISLFQRKADALESHPSAHKQTMRDLYLTIVEHCRDALDKLRTAPVSMTGTDG